MRSSARFFLAGLLLIALSCFRLSTYADSSPELVGWWRLNEAAGTFAADSSGHGNHGTLFRNAYFTTDPTMGNVVYIGEGEGAVLVPHDPSLEPPTGTLQAWVKFDHPQDSDIVRKTTNLMVRSGRSGVFTVYGLRITRNGRVVGFVADNARPDYYWTYVYSKPGLLKADTWHHLAVRWDGNSVAVFLDGRLRAASGYYPIPGSGLSYHGSSTFGLGVGTVWSSLPHEHQYDGLMADVRLYAGPRSEEQIFNDYSAVRSLLLGR